MLVVIGVKKKILDTSTKILKESGSYDEEQIEIILYGLEGLYLTITKLVIIFLVSIVLGIVKDVICLLIAYNVIRSQAFGIHASKSIYCLISSLITFVGGALICKYVELPNWFMICGSIVCSICLLLYAPADTHKRPIVNAKKRKRFKFVSFTLGIVYTILIVLCNDVLVCNYLFFGMLAAVLMILPITYSTFNMPYANYKTYYNGV